MGGVANSSVSANPAFVVPLIELRSKHACKACMHCQRQFCMCFAMQEVIQHARRDERAADFGGPVPPKGSKILRTGGCKTGRIGG